MSDADLMEVLKGLSISFLFISAFCAWLHVKGEAQ